MATSVRPNEGAEMILCESCGHMVPESNMTMHRARNCNGRARVSSTNNDRTRTKMAPFVSSNIRTDNDSDDDDDDDSKRSATQTSASRKRSDGTPSNAPPRRRQRQGRLKRDDDYNSSGDEIEEIQIDDDDDDMDIEEENTTKHEVVDLLDSDDDEAVEVKDDDNDEWACPRCTLLNDLLSRKCDACGHRNPTTTASSNSTRFCDGVRPPDPVRRERLIGGDLPSPGSDPPSPFQVVGGGALLGASLGAAGAYFRGESMSSGALNGGFAGALGGVALNEALRSPDRRSNSRTSSRRSTTSTSISNDEFLAESRSSGATGQPGYPSFTSHTGRTQRPRSSFRISESSGTNGRSTVVVTSRTPGGHTTYRRVTRDSGQNDAFLLNTLLHTFAHESNIGRAGFGGAGGIDRMSYEQLLSAFGDGTENLGASVGAISSLPVAKVKTKEDGKVDLPSDACQCAICLEDFEGGQSRKTLPCLHGFHEGCVDKWLQTNGACPVCKYRIDQRENSDN